MSASEKYPILGQIDCPEDLKKIPENKMPELCSELRDFLVENVNRTGGHLASNLGVVELSVALHRVFSTPKDHIIFDVGHQSYVHKILTGRRDSFDTLRQPGGLSGFEKRSESEHDCFGAGHSSTSISAALGFAQSDKLAGSDAYTVAVVGDGAMTGGMIHEALNNCSSDLKLIIILNENEMSISRNIGRFAATLSKLRSTVGYGKTKKFTRRLLLRIPLVGKGIFRFVRATKKRFKNALYGSNYFEDLGLFYMGPIDGNDYEQVEATLKNAKMQPESVVVHLKTKKGLGYEPAEKNPGEYHSVYPDKAQGHSENFSSVFGDELSRLAEKDEKICAITAAMCYGTGLTAFKEKFPKRFFDVGIAEEHAVTYAAGLAANGMKPVTAIYSTFLQRAYDNVIHDVALQSLPVLFGVDRAGLNPSDGATHHGIFDVSFLSQIPGMTIYTPATYEGLRHSLREALADGKMCAVRYPAGKENPQIKRAFYEEGFGTDGIGLRSTLPENSKPDLLIVTHGKIAAQALSAADALAEQGIRCGIALLEKLKPYGECAERLVPYMPSEKGSIIFLEEEIRAGGMGICLSDEMRRRGMLDGYMYEIMATDDSFAVQEKKENIYDTAKISAQFIVKTALELEKKHKNTSRC